MIRCCGGGTITDDIKELLKNPARRLSEEIAAARLERAKLKLDPDWNLPTLRSHPQEGFSPELIRKLGGG